MKYIIGFDGGGTKTRCVLGDNNGNILADFSNGPSNHQTIGIEKTKEVLELLLTQVLNHTKLSINDINYIFLGLAGADLTSDFELLESVCSELFGQVPFEVVNDAWIIMRSGTTKPFGVVSICGTGANAGAINKDGEMKILRSLGYNLGGIGGGGEIALNALHFAFRSNEKTYKQTKLETEIPKLLNLNNIEELLDNLYPINKLSNTDLVEITPLVFELAGLGDEVCQEILIQMGTTQGMLVNGVVEQANMIDNIFTVILGGSVFKGDSPYFIESMKKVILEKSSNAKFHFSKLQPVAGAYLFGLDRLNISLEDNNLKSLEKKLSI